jgi:hypothetical protein
MSTILKALRKLEEEKRAAAPGDLPGQVLAGRTAAPRRARSAQLVAAGVAGGLLLAVLALAGITWLQKPAPDASLVQEALPAAAAVETLATMPVQPQEQSPATPAAAGPTASQGAPGPGAAKDYPRAAPVKTAVPASPPAVLSRPGALTGRDEPAQAASMAPAVPLPAVEQVNVADIVLPPPGKVWTAPALLVTEIFPANAAGGRMALVNGLPVMEGTRVDGALVKEIRAGEVLFESDGRSFAVPLRTE